MQQAQAVLKQLNPDVLLLQEVRDWKAAEELCSAVPGLTVDVASSFQGRPQNVVIASKLPADSGWSEMWKPTLGPEDPPRGYAFTAFKLPRNHLLLVYSVHLKSNLGGIEKNIPAREEAAKQLLAHAKEMARLYQARGRVSIIVGGDFNSNMDGSSYVNDHALKELKASGMKWAWEGVPFSNRITIPKSGKYPADCYDHILYWDMQLLSVKVVPAVPPSDHNAVLAVFDN
jgi:endonuclease/exonuclease/phosphatase (EEP) superfamily protein YafD